MSKSNVDTPFIVAAVDMLGRTGAKETQIRYSDDEEPTIWMAAAHWSVPFAGPVTVRVWRTGSGLTPEDALYDLLEKVLDGGICRHCGFITQVERDHTAKAVFRDSCLYTYDPELHTFRRSCEGDT